MIRRSVVTCFLRNGGLILVLKRSSLVLTHRGKWAGVSGGIEAATPTAQAYREIREETGLNDREIELRLVGEPLLINDSENDVEWEVHPFLFDMGHASRIRLDWEHTEYIWVAPSEIGSMDTLPGLEKTWKHLTKG